MRRGPALLVLALAGLAARPARSDEAVVAAPATAAGPERVRPAAPGGDGGPTMDLPDYLGKLTGLWEANEVGEKQRRFASNVFPFIVSSPLIGLGGGVAAAGVFRLGGEDTRLSKFATSPFVTVNRQLSFPLRTNVFLPENGWNLVGYWNWRKFPSPTWGIGGGTPDSAKTVVDYSLVKFYETVYREIVPALYAGLGYHLDWFYAIRDTGSAAVQAATFGAYPYGTGTTSLSSGLSLNLLYSTRDNPVNATRGFHLTAGFKVSPTWLGSDATWRSLYLDLRAYVPAWRRDVLAFWAYAWVNGGDTPYLLLPSIGSDPDARSGRGYVEGRHIGQALLYAEVEYRLHLWEFLGAIVAANVHSAAEAGSGGLAGGNQFRYWSPAGVVGLRVLINRASHANVVLDYAVGLDGSRGFYLNVNETF